MGIPESQLDTWAHQGSISQSSTTYATVKKALEDSGAGYSDKNYSIFLQGSYGNDTNIYAESDVDVVIQIDSTYQYDISKLTAAEQAAFHAGTTNATYSYSHFKSHVVEVLERRFGKAAITADTKAVKIASGNGRRSADVLVAMQHRTYEAYLPVERFVSGLCFYTADGSKVVNYPRQHSTNCTTKHQASALWFKPMVRILKNMRSKLVSDGVIDKKTAPSYYVEGLMYNVPNDKFGKNYAATFTEAINWIHQADRAQFVCANEKYYLLRDALHTCWPTNDGDKFLNAVTKLWNEW